MRAGFCTNAFGKAQKAMEACIPELGRLGYDCLEFWDQYLTNANLGWVKETVAAHGMEIVQVCPYFDFTTSEETWAQSLRDAERHIGYAVELECPFVRTYTGNVGSADASPEQWRACVEGLKRICEMGAERGIGFPLETHQVIHSGPNLTDTSETTLRLLDDVGMDNLQVNLQTPLLNETVFQTAEQLGEHVVHLHAHNWIEEWPRLTFLDSGDVDFGAFLRVLRAKGFDGVISIEHGNHHPPYETAGHEIGYLKGLIADLEGGR
ncbi:MAG: sugar phosphate isomerase/epimerase family protein [Candidatus Latescibacteria bacterium]|jgi:sugar phosphate isomerase/epimerase|nr:sugar phosphate isomerase/epimerase family protein [Candidatus Latescibacterota bacterium]